MILLQYQNVELARDDVFGTLKFVQFMEDGPTSLQVKFWGITNRTTSISENCGWHFSVFAGSNEVVHTAKVSHQVISVTFSRDGRYVAAAGVRESFMFELSPPP